VSTRQTILVFDSGLGGLTVLREIVVARPDAHYVYVADDAFFPYGHHSEDEIIARVVPLIGELIAAHAPDLVVIACNTASTLVMSHLRERYKVPFVGLRQITDQARLGARHQRHRQTRIHEGADPRFCARLRRDAGGLG
jgi:glutamate racemase